MNIVPAEKQKVACAPAIRRFIRHAAPIRDGENAQSSLKDSSVGQPLAHAIRLQLRKYVESASSPNPRHPSRPDEQLLLARFYGHMKRQQLCERRNDQGHPSRFACDCKQWMDHREKSEYVDQIKAFGIKRQASPGADADRLLQAVASAGEVQAAKHGYIDTRAA